MNTSSGRSSFNQAGWGLADQVLSSGTNFGVAIVVARALGPSQFGSLAIATSIWLVGQSLTRAVLIQPFVLRASNLKGEDRGLEISRAGGALLSIGVASSLFVLPVGFALGLDTETGRTVTVLSVAMLPLLFQDFWRFVGFSTQRADLAFFNDLIWAAGTTLGLYLLWTSGMLSAASAMAAWAVGAFAGALAGAWQFHVLPNRRSSWVWLKETFELGGWFALDSVLYSIGAQSIVWLVGLNLGAAPFGGLRSVQNLYGPVLVVSRASESIGLPATAREKLRHGIPGAIRVGAIISTILAVLVMGYIGFLILAGPSVVGVVFGPEFLPYADLMVPVGLMVLGNVVSSGASLGVRASELTKLLALTSFSVSLLGVLSVALVIGPYGISGVAWAMACLAWLRVLLLWTGLSIAARQAGEKTTLGGRSPTHLPPKR